MATTYRLQPTSHEIRENSDKGDLQFDEESAESTAGYLFVEESQSLIFYPRHIACSLLVI
jgi:hypothetical protein